MLCLGQCRELGGAQGFQTLQDGDPGVGDRLWLAAEPVLVAASTKEGLDLEGGLRGVAGGELFQPDASRDQLFELPFFMDLALRRP